VPLSQPDPVNLVGPAKQLGKLLLDVIFPSSCLHCSEPIEDTPYRNLCAACARELYLVSSPACSTCGFPFFGALIGDQICPHCADLDPVFEEGKTLFLAKGPGRALIHALKYHQGFYILKDVETMLRQSPEYLDYLCQSVLVPVPLHSVKQRQRGFNQSERIARKLAQVVGGGCCVELLLERSKYTKTQTRLSREARERNVKNAFSLTTNALLMPDTHYILVDDVFTTGATLNACSRVLRDAGARHIKVATLGHG